MNSHARHDSVAGAELSGLDIQEGCPCPEVRVQPPVFPWRKRHGEVVGVAAPERVLASAELVLDPVEVAGRYPREVFQLGKVDPVVDSRLLEVSLCRGPHAGDVLEAGPERGTQTPHQSSRKLG